MDASQPIYWEESPAGRRAPFESCNPHDETHRLKEENALYNGCDTNLNFSAATCSEDDYEYAGGGYKKSKSARQDPMSHRIIEKRRRDRMNNCLADLSRLIPAEYLKKGRGRIEKTEIIEMAIKHMKYLQREHGNPTDHYRLGYQECMSETMRFLVEIEGHFPREPFCLRLLNHLQAHCEHITHPSAFGGAGAPAPASRDPSAGDYPPSAMPQDRNNNESEAIATDGEYCKNAEASGGVSYKYKTNIKMRFSRDTNGTGRRIGSERRGSLNSVENRSSSYGSPPSGEPHTRASESDNAHGRSPSGSNSSIITPKLEPPANDSLQSHASVRSTSPPQAAKNPQVKRHSGSANAAPSSSERNFDVPIFALHTKRSHYVPLAVDYRTLAPYLGDGDLLEGVATDALHPVTINVRFAPSCRGFGDAGGKCRGYCDWT